MKRGQFYIITLVLVLKNINCAYSQIDTTDFYPIAIGNYWKYKTPTGVRVYTIEKDTLISNLLVYKVLITESLISKTEGFFYKNESTLSVYDEKFELSHVFHLKKLTLRDTLFDGAYTGVIKNVKKTIKYPSNIPISNLIEVETMWADSWLRIYYKKGIGLVAVRNIENEMDYLYECKLGGDIYKVENFK